MREERSLVDKQTDTAPRLEPGRYYYVLAHKDNEEDRFVCLTTEMEAKFVPLFSEPEYVEGGIAAVVNLQPDLDTSDLAVCPYELDNIVQLIGALGARGYAWNLGTQEEGWVPLYLPIEPEEVRLSRLDPHGRYYMLTPNPEVKAPMCIDHLWARFLPLFKTAGAARRYAKLIIGSPKYGIYLPGSTDLAQLGARRPLGRVSAGAYVPVELSTKTIRKMVATVGITHYALNPDEDTSISEAVSVKE